MPRRSYKRVPTEVDAVYQSFEVAKLINYIMIDGKKTVAEKVTYNALKKLAATTTDPLETFFKAIAAASPAQEVRSRRLGGASYQVPTEVHKARKLHLALNWIIEAAQARANKEYKTFSEKLVAELTDAANGIGAAVTKKQNAEKQADQNKAFSHLKW